MTSTSSSLDNAVESDPEVDAPDSATPAAPVLKARRFHVPHVPAERVRWLARPGVEPVLVTLLFTLLTVLMTWPWTLHIGEAINPFGDVVLQMTTMQWSAHALTTNPGALFEAPFFYPYQHSLAFAENLIGQTILTLPILLISGNPALASNFYVLLTFVLTGLFTYLLVRDLTGSRLAGLLSGIAFAFCPFRFMQMGHVNILSTQWFPFTLWALRRGLGVLDYGHWTSRFGPVQQKSIVRHPRAVLWLIVAAIGFVAMGLSSVYYTYFLVLAVALYLLWWFVSEWFVARRVANVQWGPVLAGGFLAIVIVGLVLGPVFWPYLQLNQEQGLSRSTYEVQNWSANWSYYRNVLQSNFLYGHLFAPSWVSAAGERELFPGIVAPLLALVGLLFGRGRARLYYLILGLFALIMTFGLSHNLPGTTRDIPLPYAFFYDWLPGFKALRVPVRFAVLVDFALYVLAGYGLARLIAMRRTTETVDAKPENLGAIVLDTQVLTPLEPESVANPVRRWPLITAGVLTLLVIGEFVNPVDASNRRDVAAQLATIEPYGWLAKPENKGPVLELPMSGDQPDVWYGFFGTKHWQPLVDTWSSFVPPGTVRLKQALDAFPDPVTVTMLQGLEVKHLVVHLWQYPKEAQAAFKARLDSTPQLKMVYQSGDNYVYTLEADPWLHAIADNMVKSRSNVWVGEARHGSMPAFEVLAYALMRWGVPANRIGGNIDIGYKPIGSLPFGTPADYVLTPNLPGLDDTPFGYEYMAEVLKNPAARLLQSPPVVARTYDMSTPSAPRLDLTNLRMGVNPDGINFGSSANEAAKPEAVAVNMTFLAFAPSQVSVQVGGKPVSLLLPAGVSQVSTRVFSAPSQVIFSTQTGNPRLLKIDLIKQDPGTGGGPDAFLLPAIQPVPVPLDVSTTREGNLLNARMSVIVPAGAGNYAATLDVYVEPWGTHPEGHFGYWSVVLPGDDLPHSFTFQLDPLLKKVTVKQDGFPVQTFGWQGKPIQGDFRATLHVTHKDAPVASVPLYLFTLDEGKLTDWQPDGPSVSVVRP